MSDVKFSELPVANAALVSLDEVPALQKLTGVVKTFTGQNILDYINANLGAGITFNVKNYGAIGNNSADDTVAIQATINAAVAAGGGTVYFPAGTYKITSELAVHTKVVNFEGESRPGAGLFAVTIRQVSTSANGIHIFAVIGMNYFRFTNIYILGVGLVSSTGNGILVDSVVSATGGYLCKFLNISGFDVGFRATNFSRNSFELCDFTANDIGFWVDGTICGGNTMISCGCASTGGGSNNIGLRLSGGTWHIIAPDVGGPGMEVCILQDGAGIVVVSGANFETGSGKIAFKNITNSTYSTLVGCVSFSPIVANIVQGPGVHLSIIEGGNMWVKQTSQIDCLLNAIGTDLQVDVYSGATLFETHRGTIFRTVSASDGTSPYSGSKGRFRIAYDLGSSDDKLQWDRQILGGSIIRVDLGQYDTDSRLSGGFVKLNDAHTWVSLQTFPDSTARFTSLGVNPAIELTYDNPAIGYSCALIAGTNALGGTTGEFGIYMQSSTGTVAKVSNAPARFFHNTALNRTHINWNTVNTTPTGTEALNLYGTGSIGMLGKINKYNGIVTQGMGVAVIVAAYQFTYNSNVSQSSGTLFTTTDAGMYRIDIQVLITVTAAAGTLAVTYNTTDTIGAVTLTAFASISQTTQSRNQYSGVFECLSGVAIAVLLTVSGNSGSPNARFSVCITKLQ